MTTDYIPKAQISEGRIVAIRVVPTGFRAAPRVEIRRERTCKRFRDMWNYAVTSIEPSEWTPMDRTDFGDFVEMAVELDKIQLERPIQPQDRCLITEPKRRPSFR